MQISNDLFPFVSSRTYSIQVVRAVAVCHERDVMHRDVKPANFLLTDVTSSLFHEIHIASFISYRLLSYRIASLIPKMLHVRLADFGLARCTNIPVRYNYEARLSSSHSTFSLLGLARCSTAKCRTRPINFNTLQHCSR